MTDAMHEPHRAAADGSGAEVRVWDPLVRAVHWIVAVLFLANALVVEEGEMVHRLIGYAVLTLVSVRVGWGVVGTRHARFSAFPPDPRAALAHLSARLAGRHPEHLSHNPLGALMAYALWALLVGIALSGMAMHAGLVGEELGEEAHEVLANLALGAAALHVVAVAVESRSSGAGLVRAMVTGWKRRTRG